MEMKVPAPRLRRLLLAMLIAVPLVADAETTVRVDSVEALVEAIENVEAQTTLLIADGHYYLPRYVEISADHVTLRSDSGNRESVILDGERSRHGELLGIRNASHVTIADLTVQNVVTNGIKINNDTPVHHVTIRNCVIRNVWQRGIKSVRSPELKTRHGLIEKCLFYNDRPKTFEDDPRDTVETFGGNYVGAIDLMDAVEWTIRDNVFRDIQGRTRTGRGAIFIWFESENCTIERNIIIDCDQGIAIGNAHITDGTSHHAGGFIVRNNVISRAPMNPVFIAHTRNSRFVHNTIHDPENPRRRSIRIFNKNGGLRVDANLINGHPVSEEAVIGLIRIENNTVANDLADLFMDSNGGDFRLAPSAGERLPHLEPTDAAPADMDRRHRAGATVAGAYCPLSPCKGDK